MKPKLAVIVTENGIEVISVLSDNPQVRLQALRLAEELNDLITAFDLAIKEKFQLKTEETDGKKFTN